CSRGDAVRCSGEARSGQRRGKRVGTVIKFPDDEGRMVRFGRGAGEPATIITLPVIRIERFDSYADTVEPTTQPPAENGGRRRVQRRLASVITPFPFLDGRLFGPPAPAGERGTAPSVLRPQ